MKGLDTAARNSRRFVSDYSVSDYSVSQFGIFVSLDPARAVECES
jgi:hypothetical protein